MLALHALGRFLGWGKARPDACRRVETSGRERGRGTPARAVSALLGVVSLGLGCGAPHTDISEVPKHRPGKNPFVGHQLLIDSQSAAALTAERWSLSRPEDARLMQKIADQPQAEWVGEWSGAVKLFMKQRMKFYERYDAMGVFVVYNIPNRDCGQHSAGGAASPEKYIEWIEKLAEGLGDSRAALILEPDAVPLLEKCTSEDQKAARYELIARAVKILKARENAIVYVDAGNARWVPPEDMAQRLIKAGLEYADGFSLNVSNYVATGETLEYGRKISALTGGAHFVIDTSRNGNGAAPGNEWCNPDGRALGHPPIFPTSEPKCDAFLWIKRPGESDGACNGGPRAGEWWPEFALGLAKRAKW
jgi:endoglucanase